MKKLFPIMILAACSFVALASKPRIKNSTKKQLNTPRETDSN